MSSNIPKLLKKEFPKESDLYELIGRAKLNKYPDEPDLLFIKEKGTGKIKLMRGPLIDEENLLDIIVINKLKKIFKLNLSELVVLNLIPDLIEGVLSSRNYVIKDRLYPFVIYNIELNTDKHSKLTKIIDDEIWGEISLINFECLKDLKIYSFENNDKLKDYILLLIFRKIIGYQNFSDIDFLIDNKQNLYLINEYNISKKFSIFREMGPEKMKIIINFIKQNMESFKKVIEEWKTDLERLLNENSNLEQNEKMRIILDNLKNLNLLNF